MAANGGLGEFLRARRARVRPTEVGLPAGTGHRRTAGLRREELAALAGISIDYCIRLEQGRETNPSAEVLNALASALLLNEEERAHLHTLARHGRSPAHRATHPHTRARPTPAGSVRPGIRQLLEQVRPSPAYVVNRASDVLAANPEALALLSGLGDWPPHRRNTARYTFLHPAARDLFADWPHTAATTAANLRTAAAEDPTAPGLAALLEELTAHSPEFTRLWQRYDVRRRQGEPKSFRHPRVGELTLSYEVLHLDGDAQRMSVYQATPGSRDHDALIMLAMLATESPNRAEPS